MFSVLRRLLFMMPPERAHDLALGAMDGLARLGGERFMPSPVEDKRRVMGLSFRNAVGLSAGLDKNGDHIRGLAAMGFGFVELGTVTPVGQPGNPPPRLFRLPAHEALINRLGFNNQGVDYLCEAVMTARQHVDIPIGINIGKNRDTPLEQAAADYCHCLHAVHAIADYVVVNLSSPNTPGLRSLQAGRELTGLVRRLQEEQGALEAEAGRRVPLVVKIAPDLTDDDLRGLVDALLECGIDGITATNTTIDHSRVAGSRHAKETGGLSGAPLRARATEVVRQVRHQAGPDLPIIAVGGIMSPADAVEKMEAGANLVQIYTGLIYKGPRLVRESAAEVRDHCPASRDLS